MSRKGTYNSRLRRLCWRIAVLGLLAMSVPALAQAEDPARHAAEVIEITGFMEWPKSDTRIPWEPPVQFDRSPSASFGQRMRDALSHPLERKRLQQRMEVERNLSR